MKVHVKCLLDLSKEDICTHHGSTPQDIPPGTTARGLAEKLQMDDAKIKLVFINYKEATLDDELHDGDDIAFSPY